MSKKCEARTISWIFCYLSFFPKLIGAIERFLVQKHFNFFFLVTPVTGPRFLFILFGGCSNKAQLQISFNRKLQPDVMPTRCISGVRLLYDQSAFLLSLCRYFFWFFLLARLDCGNLLELQLAPNFKPAFLDQLCGPEVGVRAMTFLFLAQAINIFTTHSYVDWRPARGNLGCYFALL